MLVTKQNSCMRSKVELDMLVDVPKLIPLGSICIVFFVYPLLLFLYCYEKRKELSFNQALMVMINLFF